MPPNCGGNIFKNYNNKSRDILLPRWLAGDDLAVTGEGDGMNCPTRHLLIIDS